MENPDGVTLEANPETGDVTARPSHAVAPLHQPGKYATPVLWFIVVLSFAIPMVLAAAAIILEFLSPGPASGKVEATLVLILFSTPAAFLSGLVLPSPFQK